MSINDGAQRDVWVYDIERDIMTRITADPKDDHGPVWTPDGTAIVFTSNRGTSNYSNLYWQRADGTGSAVRLTSDPEGQIPGSFSPDGRQLIFHAGDPAAGRQRVMVLTLNGIPPSGEQEPAKEFVGGGFLKANPRFSPDGKWVAYAANYSGPYEIFVQPFPGPGERVQVSSGGGNLAVWSPIRNELYYVGAGQGRLMMVPFTVEAGTFRPSKAQLWSQTTFSAAPPFSLYGPSFDIHRDGQRFAVAPSVAPTSGIGAPHVMLFFNFFDELRRLAPIR
jgi:Tol biopolymer transport system component